MAHKVLSNKVGLHIYPIHALQLSARLDDVHQLKLLRKLQCLTVVHSKFILLLQSLAHSSLQPLEPELEVNLPPRLILQSILPPGIRQLYFPEPIYYSDSPAIRKTPSYRRQRRSQSLDIVIGETKKPGRFRSLLRRSRQPLPPPSPDFLVHRSYFSPWRRILRSPPSTGIIEPTSQRRRRFLNASSCSDSSLSTSPRLSMIQEGRRSSSVPRLRTLPQSPHDVHFATSRSHAPILRVFVPCSELSDLSIAACEDQLTDAGLWNHLSIGDVVCNLGYVPQQPPPEHDPAGASPTSPRSQQPSLGSGVTDDSVWLVYDGFGLVQYSPISEPPPLKDALALVTPYYYSHILPTSAHPFFTLDLYSRLSRFRESAGGTMGNVSFQPAPPKFELIAMLTKVRSPSSPGGYAMVKRYKWIATIRGIRAAISGDSRIGAGWLADEWVLEVDGTLEGRGMLDSLLSPPGAHVAADSARGDWVWEIDRQRSNPSKFWLRSVHFRHTPNIWVDANFSLFDRLLGSSENYALPLDPATLGPMSVAPFRGGSPASVSGKRPQLSFMAR